MKSEFENILRKTLKDNALLYDSEGKPLPRNIVIDEIVLAVKVSMNKWKEQNNGDNE